MQSVKTLKANNTRTQRQVKEMLAEVEDIIVKYVGTDHIPTYHGENAYRIRRELKAELVTLQVEREQLDNNKN